MKFELFNEIDTEARTKETLLKNLRKAKNMVDIKDNATPCDFAKAGFFYSHPRMTGLQVHVQCTWRQRHKKSKLSGRQNFTRKNFPDEARKSFPRHKRQKCVNCYCDKYIAFFANFVGG